MHLILTWRYISIWFMLFLLINYHNAESLVMSSSGLSDNAITTNNIKISKTGWRVALNIGREPTTNGMPLWGASGARLPIVIPCDFLLDNNDRQLFRPKDNCIRFTGPMGEVVKKVNGMEWSYNEKENTIQFGFEFLESFTRRDINMDAPCTIYCEGKVYSTSDIKTMDERFYKARDESYEAEEIVNDVQRRKEAPRKWNEEKGEWEKRFEDESSVVTFFKRMNFERIERDEKDKNTSRPLPRDLSLDCGPFPGFSDEVYVRNDGVIKLKSNKFWKGDIVIGSWSAEPISNKPKSYY
mmetsp:Transcript_23059/g.26308  ORF Transcript_23059/g.26308 Transcript_23059/m.26308 type:complete len:297 (+) Transcript_23059:76-966(+)